jgi:hypothetical protein
MLKIFILFLVVCLILFGFRLFFGRFILCFGWLIFRFLFLGLKRLEVGFLFFLFVILIGMSEFEI